MQHLVIYFVTFILLIFSLCTFFYYWININLEYYWCESPSLFCFFHDTFFFSNHYIHSFKPHFSIITLFFSYFCFLSNFSSFIMMCMCVDVHFCCEISICCSSYVVGQLIKITFVILAQTEIIYVVSIWIAIKLLQIIIIHELKKLKKVRNIS